MKTVHTFSVVFWLKKRSTKKDGTIPIYARITVDGIRADVSTKHSVLQSYWSYDTGRVKTKVNGAKSINDDLMEVYQDITQSKKELLEEGRILTAQSVKLRYLGQDVPLRTLKDLLQYHKDNEVQKLEAGTAKNYGATEKYLLLFIKKKYKSSNVHLGHINYSFVLNFENYLRNCKPLKASQPLTNNGIMKHMERLKKMTTIAFKLDCIKKDPFAFFRANFNRYDRPYLKIEELKLMESLSLKDIGLGYVRDVFVFACYTGLSYIDAKQLKPEHVVLGMDGDDWIFTRREKSETFVKIPLLEKAKAILNKYADKLYGKNEDLLLPVYSNQKCNKYLKVLASKCGIDKNLSFHCARHTFATSVTLANGVPIETVSKLLGHKKLSTTQIYARVLEKKISEDISDLKTKLKSTERKVA